MAHSGTPLIKLEGINKIYHAGDIDVQVLHDVNLEIEAGEFIAIMGSSGSGKTTLMNVLGCLDQATSGRYFFGGREVSHLSLDELALLRRDAFGFVFQHYNLLPTASATENVEIPAIYAGLKRSARHARAHQLLSSLGLANRLDHRPGQLSGGQQQRVSIARALMNGGAVILADEPTGALDSQSGREVMQLLSSLHASGKTIILITHDAEVAAQSHRIVTIADGKIVSDQAGFKQNSAAQISPSMAPRFSGIGFDALETVTMALRSLKANVFRTALTLLGIIIGVAAVVGLMAIGNGIQDKVLSDLEAMGTDLLVVTPGGPNIRTTSGAPATLTKADAEAVARLPNIDAVIPEMGGSVTARYGNIDYRTFATATSADYARANNWSLEKGAFFNADQVERYLPVAVLGRTVANNLFPDGKEPVGEFILLNRIPFQIIGVLSAKGSSDDDSIVVPLTTGSVRLLGKRYLRSITAKVQDLSLMSNTEEAVKALLTARHTVEDFQLRNMASLLETRADFLRTFTLFLGSLAAISLLVGGIGVMNIMLVTVTERMREIGIRMATGARPLNILTQFLVEALVVCSIGGILGIVFGVAIALVARSFEVPVSITFPPMAMAFGCAFLIGLFFGLMPARKASRLDPVLALASE